MLWFNEAALLLIKPSSGLNWLFIKIRRLIQDQAWSVYRKPSLSGNPILLQASVEIEGDLRERERALDVNMGRLLKSVVSP